jgi:phosphoribosylanthranilate isomerase
MKIKICGIRTLPDALAAIEAGADLVGFNFYRKSARFVDVQTCQRICSALRQSAPRVQLVGVFVNAPIDEIEQALEFCSLDLAQLSGDESPELCAALGGKGFKSFHGIPGGNVRPYARGGAPDFLVDAAVSGLYGGTGVTGDWSGAARLARDYQLLLAGGLAPGNVAQAIEQVKPWGVDVASGVESRPGVKDPGRMRAFVEAARSMELESR